MKRKYKFHTNQRDFVMNQNVGLCGLKSKVQIGDETNSQCRHALGEKSERTPSIASYPPTWIKQNHDNSLEYV